MLLIWCENCSKSFITIPHEEIRPIHFYLLQRFHPIIFLKIPLIFHNLKKVIFPVESYLFLCPLIGCPTLMCCKCVSLPLVYLVWVLPFSVSLCFWYVQLLIWLQIVSGFVSAWSFFALSAFSAWPLGEPCFFFFLCAWHHHNRTHIFVPAE